MSTLTDNDRERIAAKAHTLALLTFDTLGTAIQKHIQNSEQDITDLSDLSANSIEAGTYILQLINFIASILHNPNEDEVRDIELTIDQTFTFLGKDFAAMITPELCSKYGVTLDEK